MNKFGLAGLLLLSACSGTDSATHTSAENEAISEHDVVAVEPGVSLALAQQRAATVSNINYDLTFHVPDTMSAPITASMVATFNMASVSADLQFDFREAEDAIKNVVVNDVPQSIDHRKEHVIIPASALHAGANTVAIDFRAGETSLNRSADFLYTLFVPDRARTAFPVFDQPNLKATYDLTLDLPESWRALANGLLADQSVNGGRRTYAFQKSDLISTYLFSFVAGEFEVITRTIGGREMTLFHRETDPEKIAGNLDTIFQQHADALSWLEEYTGIPYPFQKFDFAAIPAFQYGGMEHVGAIQYRATSLFLDDDASQAQHLGRANVIAHETAHMWFGDLVTMDWFNDVWTKEVFANFMASKIVNPGFPDIDHDLNFLLSRYPAAYSVDRTEGANPIRQNLPNLNEAGTMYGAIIYNKAPIMMRQLETLLGKKAFKEGMRTYLAKYANANATWPDLIDILDALSPQDLKAWSEVWVNTPGRPVFELNDNGTALHQKDPASRGRFWPQQFTIADAAQLNAPVDARFVSQAYQLEESMVDGDTKSLFVNANGMGYGLFPASIAFVRENWTSLSDLQKGSLFINLFEQMQESGGGVSPAAYMDLLTWVAVREYNELLLDEMLNQMEIVFWSYLSVEAREHIAEKVEGILWLGANDTARTNSTRKVFFNRFRNMATSKESVARLYGIWSGEHMLEGLSFSEREMMALAGVLAIKSPTQAEDIISQQSADIKNPDNKRRFTFLAPSLSSDEAVRDAFFASLAMEENRAIENWVLVALGNLHHPLRVGTSEKYILPSLELVEEIQRTGDIFFPAGWTGQTLVNHRSASAVKTVRDFLEKRPDYNYQMKLKILQAADRMFRAHMILQEKS